MSKRGRKLMFGGHAQITLALHPGVHETLRRIATHRGISLSRVVRDMIDMALAVEWDGSGPEGDIGSPHWLPDDVFKHWPGATGSAPGPAERADA